MALDLAADLDFAHSLADAADAFTLPHFNARSFTVSLKSNLTEVTEIDRGCETIIMDLVREHRPHHAWYGEEHGTGGGDDAEWTWVIDPIDGTSNFVRGVPVWATLIALVQRDLGPVLGVVSAPAMHARWWGLTEGGAYCNGHPISVSDVSELSEASLSIVGEQTWRDAGRADWVKHLKSTVKRVRGYGDFWQHMLVAQGAVDIAIDTIGLEPYDIAALIPVVHGAGGSIIDQASRINWQGKTAISTNGSLEII